MEHHVSEHLTSKTTEKTHKGASPLDSALPIGLAEWPLIFNMDALPISRSRGFYTVVSKHQRMPHGQTSVDASQSGWTYNLFFKNGTCTIYILTKSNFKQFGHKCTILKYYSKQ